MIFRNRLFFGLISTRSLILGFNILVRLDRGISFPAGSTSVLIAQCWTDL